MTFLGSGFKDYPGKGVNFLILGCIYKFSLFLAIILDSARKESRFLAGHILSQSISNANNLTSVCKYFTKECNSYHATTQKYLLLLTLKVRSTTAASKQQSRIFFHFFSEKIRLYILCESSARQRIHMKHQALFSWKDKTKKNKSVVCCNLAWLARTQDR